MMLRTEMLKALNAYPDLETVTVNIGFMLIKVNTVTSARGTVCIEPRADELAEALDQLVKKQIEKAPSSKAEPGA